MFKIGDKVAYPMHGAGIISDIVEEKIGMNKLDYYVFQMPVGGLVLKIPVEASQTVGLRCVMAPEEAVELIAALPELQVEMDGNWNHRYRENLERIKSGDLYEVARVIKGLSRRDAQRGLSNGERKMLHSAKQILISEFVLTLERDYGELEKQINMAVAGEKAG